MNKSIPSGRAPEATASGRTADDRMVREQIREQMGVLNDSELRTSLEAAFERRHQVDAELAQLAGEVVHRSRSSLGPDGLSVRSGNGTPAVYIADVGLITRAEANRLCRVGEATAPSVSFLGELLPAAYPILAAALDAGAMPIDSANFIVNALEQAAPRADAGQLQEAERRLVEFALNDPADSVRKAATSWRDALDADGIEPREAELIEKVSLRRTILASGMKRYVLDLDPLSAAHLDAAIDAQVGAVLRAPRFTSPDGVEPSDGSQSADGCGDDHELLADPRTLTQIGADAIVQLARHGNSCTNRQIPTRSATVVVRMTLESLMTGLGEASIDGIEQPISATAARRLAADANIIPLVLGGKGEVLDLGAPARLFSRAQRIAFADRDGGCAWRNCHRPPSYTEAHHIKWWQYGGETNLDNGVLLCSMHHHRIHRDGWEVRVTDNVPWFTPPSHVDAYRTQRRGGRLPAPTAQAVEALASKALAS